MSHYFNIRVDTFRNRIQEFVNSFDSDVDFYVFDELPCDKAMSSVEDGNIDSVAIGTGSCRNVGLFRKYIHDVDYARVVMNSYHEFEHCNQCNIYFQKSHDVRYQKQAVEQIARFDNEEYYSSSYNYIRNANEIQAEMNAYRSTVLYLNRLNDTSTDKVNIVMLELMNEKCKNDYFIKPANGDSFQSLSEIDELFAEAYENSLSDKSSAKKLYFVDRKPVNGKLDAFKAYIQNDKVVREAYLDAKTKYEQDLIIASVNTMLHPEYKTYFKCLENVDMSYEYVILHHNSVIKHNQRVADLDSKFGNIGDLQSSEIDLQKY